MGSWIVSPLFGNVHAEGGRISKTQTGTKLPDICLHYLLTYIKITQAGITFHMAKDLRSQVEMLPRVPEWKFKTVSLTGHPTQEPMLLFYHNTLKCVEYLFRNPIFTDWVDSCPVQFYRNSKWMVRMYSEWMTGNAAWEMQVCTYISITSILYTGLNLPIGNASKQSDTCQYYPFLG